MKLRVKIKRKVLPVGKACFVFLELLVICLGIVNFVFYTSRKPSFAEKYSLQAVWTFQVPTRVISLTSSDKIFVRTESNIYALEAVTGSEIWKIDNNTPQWLPPVECKEKLLAPTDETSITAIDPASGKNFKLGDDSHFDRYGLLSLFQHHGIPDAMYMIPPRTYNTQSAYDIDVIYFDEKKYGNVYGERSFI
jgi:hypothetical protein